MMVAKGMVARAVATSARESALAAALNLPARRLAITYRAIFPPGSSDCGGQDRVKRAACRHCVWSGDPTTAMSPSVRRTSAGRVNRIFNTQVSETVAMSGSPYAAEVHRTSAACKEPTFVAEESKAWRLVAGADRELSLAPALISSAPLRLRQTVAPGL
jgi:hypothetical protein